MLVGYFIFLLILIAIFVLLKNYKSALTWILIFRLNFLGFGLGYIPDLLLSHLQVYSQTKDLNWSEKNLIILLGSGQTKWKTSGQFSPQQFGLTRLLEAFRQYQNCKKTNQTCHILAVGGDPVKRGQTEALVFKNYLVELGVNEKDIFLEEQSRNTIENADFANEFLKKNQYDFKTLVTSSFHMTRALMCFNLVGVNDLNPSPADYLQVAFISYPNTHNLNIANLSFHEYAGIIQVILKKNNPQIYEITKKYF